MKEIIQFKKDFLKLIKSHQSIIIFHHINPDGDCLGSQQALNLWIKNKFPNKKVYAIGQNNGTLKFMNFKFDNIPSKEELSNSLGIVVDANYSNRIMNKEIILNNEIKTMIRIDHHPENDDINYVLRFVDSSYSSSAEQIAHLIYLIDSKSIDEKIALYLYLGIYTDSGRFFYDKTSSRTHLLVSWLLNSGFDVNQLHKELAKRDQKELIFLKDVMNNYQTKKNVIYYYISQKRSKQLNLKENEKNRVDFLANIDPYNIWIFFIENEDGTIRVRLRSNEININKLAQQYNGGGHEKAAGATLESEKQIEELVTKATKLK